MARMPPYISSSCWVARSCICGAPTSFPADLMGNGGGLGQVAALCHHAVRFFQCDQLAHMFIPGVQRAGRPMRRSWPHTGPPQMLGHGPCGGQKMNFCVPIPFRPLLGLPVRQADAYQFCLGLALILLDQVADERFHRTAPHGRNRQRRRRIRKIFISACPSFALGSGMPPQRAQLNFSATVRQGQWRAAGSSAFMRACSSFQRFQNGGVLHGFGLGARGEVPVPAGRHSLILQLLRQVFFAKYSQRITSAVTPSKRAGVRSVRQMLPLPQAVAIQRLRHAGHPLCRVEQFMGTASSSWISPSG